MHAASIVIDAYGFSPRSAVNGAEMRAAVEAGASDIELQDLQEEMNMTRCVTNAAERDEYHSAWKASGVTCIVQNAGEEGQDPLRLIKRLARFTYVTDMLRDVVEKASAPDDIAAVKKRGKHCLYFSGNGVPLTQQWASVEDELRYIRIFFQLGIRIMHLTYNRRNMIGDGCAEPANAGLSDFGRAVIAEMNRVGVIPDCAHSGWQTSLEAAKVSRKPVVASHSGCAVNRHIRCKPDEIIRALADSGGYIGICCIPGFLGGAGDINVMLDHIDHVKKRFGAEHVAIGTDTAYLSSANAAEARKIRRIAGALRFSRCGPKARSEAAIPLGRSAGPTASTWSSVMNTRLMLPLEACSGLHAASDEVMRVAVQRRRSACPSPSCRTSAGRSLCSYGDLASHLGVAHHLVHLHQSQARIGELVSK